VSATQNAASAVAGRGWRGFSGWGKVGAATVAVAALTAVIILPDLLLGGHTAAPKEPPRTDQDNPNPEPFKPPPRTAAASQGALPYAGQPGRTVHHLPPPLEIGSYIALPRQAAGGAAAPVARQAGYEPAPGVPQGGAAPVMVPVPMPGTAPAPPSPDSLAAQTSGATVLQVSSAGTLPHPDYTITAGSKIPCLPVEAADSSLGGFYSCRVPEYVRGTTQQRALLPPGTLVFGQVRKGMDEGQERLAIIYTRIETAGDHFIIRLSAPAADAMGRSGVKGDLDTHFWPKVGDVALYALIDGLQNAIPQAASAGINGLANGGGNGNAFLNLNLGAAAGGQSLAQMEMQKQINRPPTMRLDQAMPMEVSVGQDLDFFAACQQRMQVSAMACALQ